MSEFTVFFHSSSGLFDKQAVELTQRGALHGRTQQTAVKFSTYWKAHRQMMLNQSRLINLSSWMIVHMDSVFRCCVYYCCVLFLYFENSYGSLWPGGKLCCYFFLFFLHQYVSWVLNSVQLTWLYCCTQENTLWSNLPAMQAIYFLLSISHCLSKSFSQYFVL